MPRTVEDLLRSGAVEVKVGSKCKKHEPTLHQVHEARRKYIEWQNRRREVQGEVQDGYTCRFLYEGRL